VEIREADAADAATIAAIHCASWRDAYANVLDPAYLRGPIEGERQSFWSARFAEADPARTVFLAAAPPAAFMCVYRDLDAVWGSLVDNLHVLPELRGRGVGERLMRTAARHLAGQAQRAGLHLWVFEANRDGLRFYRRLGGEVADRNVSRIPAARGATVLRVVWPDVAALIG